MSSLRSERDRLLRRVRSLAGQALFGSLAESYRTCGQPSCRCHQGQKHGPHLYVSFRGEEGKTAGYYVPKELSEPMRAGVAAWQELTSVLRELAECNRELLWASRGKNRTRPRVRRRRDGSSRVPAAKRL
jgi:hypothetical protein